MHAARDFIARELCTDETASTQLKDNTIISSDPGVEGAPIFITFPNKCVATNCSPFAVIGTPENPFEIIQRARIIRPNYFSLARKIRPSDSTRQHKSICGNADIVAVVVVLSTLS